MARFSLSPPASSIHRQPQSSSPSTSTTPDFKWRYPPQDNFSTRLPVSTNDDGDTSSDDDESTTPTVDYSDSSSTSSEEEEPPHPLGFESRYGTTRFGPSLSSCYARTGRGPPRDIFNVEDEGAWNALVSIDQFKRGGVSASSGVQSFPPIGGYFNQRGSGVSTKVLLDGAMVYARSRDEEKEMQELLLGMDRIAHLVEVASALNQHAAANDDVAASSTLSPFTVKSPSYPSQPAPSRKQRVVSPSDWRNVNKKRKKLRLQRIKWEEELERQRQREEQLELERREKAEIQSKEEELKQQQRAEQFRKAEEEAELEAKSKNAHVDRASSLISNLDTVRTSLSEFDKSKTVGKRRLQFKKVVNGKINTLSHEDRKIMEVAGVVVDAIGNAEREDAESVSAGGEGVMGMGKKYLLDLLASNLIVRVQADGFNGTRGDGFPLAAMFASVSTHCDELGPLLEAHLYTVCPTAIPTLSMATAEGDENALMESLGMIKDKSGEFESFDKFLHRTEGLISIMADIMSSLPSSHTLLGGHLGAITWLERFMDILPASPTSPLPLLTAPVLVAFLTGAGHMLANKFPTQFQPIFEIIKNDIMDRLDDSPVGVPSATRLKKVIEGGWNGLKKRLASWSSGFSV
eukprot:g8591.t1 g8591   contig3:441835-444082(+)